MSIQIGFDCIAIGRICSPSKNRAVCRGDSTALLVDCAEVGLITLGRKCIAVEAVDAPELRGLPAMGASKLA